MSDAPQTVTVELTREEAMRLLGELDVTVRMEVAHLAHQRDNRWDSTREKLRRALEAPK